MIYNIGEFYFNQTGKQETGLKTVNTVLGPLETAKIGFALMHDHVLGAASGIPQVYPELLGENVFRQCWHTTDVGDAVFESD